MFSLFHIHLLHRHAMRCFDADEIDALAIAAQVEGGVAFGCGLHQLLAEQVAHADAHRALAFNIEEAVGRIGIDADLLNLKYILHHIFVYIHNLLEDKLQLD